MKTKYILLLFTVLFFTSCFDDLNVTPLDPRAQTPDQVYQDPANVEKGLLKIYSVWAISGQDGIGSSDILGLDPGNAQLLRSWWNIQVITTDECKNAWKDDAWVPEINGILWSDIQNESLEGVYQRCMYIVALSNEFLLRTTNIAAEANPVQVRAEARFNRALAYYTLMDIYAIPPFITENNYSKAPAPLNRSDLFAWIDTELNDIYASLPDARKGTYGRADKGAVDALLARMYLNAEVYTGKAMYTECIAACNRILSPSTGYALASDYSNIFKADNNTAAGSEIIFPIVFSGVGTETYGGMTYLIASSRAQEDVREDRDGLVEAWGGNRSTQNLVNKFEFADPNNKTANTILDKRGIFFSDNRSINISTTPINTFLQEGWSVYKFKNVTSTGAPGSNNRRPDTDFPLFRLGDVYLMYAESVVRGGQGGSRATALSYINALRKRGYGNDIHSISDSQMTKEFILDERARELYWEGTRRTDLIRYGLYTGSGYLWAFKGGVASGVAVSETRNVCPIPVSDMAVNQNLKQNPGY